MAEYAMSAVGFGFARLHGFMRLHGLQEVSASAAYLHFQAVHHIKRPFVHCRLFLIHNLQTCHTTSATAHDACDNITKFVIENGSFETKPTLGFPSPVLTTMSTA